MPRTIRIASVNVNGVRAAYRKGMGDWLETRGVDVLALQEVRATRADLEPLIGDGWHLVNDETTAKGRAGVAIASRLPIVESRTAFGADEFDSAGRWIEADVDVDGTPLTVASVYVHSGEADTPKQDEKWKFLDALATRLPELAERGRVVLLGDFNVGHTELDIKNWRGNRKKAGFLPGERAYFDRFFGEIGSEVTCVDGTVGTGLGWVDVGRRLSGEVEGPYSWWSNRGQAFDNDTGWRIDYHIATPLLAARASNYLIDRAASYDARWSDHAPVVADYEI
ncbi:exodeoxyribonuclease III [Pseudoclavibacter endophyticus]|uniref:Exodeoxyribonuclease III n=1 Tax=Pseudoclavibacter endophyticus TaxID=1778590 RepID=A0A6H9WNH0_9MICO|nr:exodeoxyribonuclease III [Pseudoclavibacter endophyticus]KAB1648166.1 exodeoxyribonuclease III [Pseudoclavibacter endophyticus]